MLSYAFVQSSVMQVTMAAAIAQPMCDASMAALGGMEALPDKASPAAPSKGRAPAKSCPYCAAAAHLPLVGTAMPWRAPSAFTFAAFRVVASHGPRGPPACRPRARGPPSDPLSV